MITNRQTHAPFAPSPGFPLQRELAQDPPLLCLRIPFAATAPIGMAPGWSVLEPGHFLGIVETGAEIRLGPDGALRFFRKPRLATEALIPIPLRAVFVLVLLEPTHPDAVRLPAPFGAFHGFEHRTCPSGQASR